MKRSVEVKLHRKYIFRIAYVYNERVGLGHVRSNVSPLLMDRVGWSDLENGPVADCGAKCNNRLGKKENSEVIVAADTICIAVCCISFIGASVLHAVAAGAYLYRFKYSRFFFR